MIQDREQPSHKHHEESWPMFMSREQREQLIQNKFARAALHFKIQGEHHVRSSHTGNILQNR
jgi:hypothetical protein